MSQPGNGPRRLKRPSKRAAMRKARERDQRDLIEHIKRHNARAADAIVTVLCRADAQTLAALGVVLGFVTMQATRGSR